MRFKRTTGFLVWVALGFWVVAGCSRQAEVATRLARAEKYYEAGQLEEALLDYMEALRLAPTNLPVMGRIGAIYYSQGNLSKAIPVLSHVKEQNPEDLDARTTLGAALLSVGRFDEAGEEVSYVLSEDLAREEAMLVMAQLATRTNGIGQATQYLEGVRSQIDQSAGFHLAYATLYLSEGRTNEARTAVDQALRIEPESVQGQRMLGDLFWAEGDLEQAGTHLAKAAELAPWRAPVRIRYVNFLIRTKGPEEGRTYLHEIAQKAPDYLPAWLLLGSLALERGDLDECGRFLDQVLKRDATNFDATLLLGRLHLARADTVKAVSVFEQMLNDYPRVARVHYYLALARLQEGDNTRAVFSLDQAVAIDPGFASAAILLAEMNLRKKDYIAVVGAMNRLIESRSDSKQPYLVLARAYHARGDANDALRIYTMLSERYPEDPQVRVLIGTVLRTLQQPAKARAAYEEALELAPDYFFALEQLVNLEIAEKRFQSASDRLRQRAAQDSENPMLPVLEAKVHLAQRDYATAEALLKKTIEKSPNLRAARLMLAEVLTNTERLKEAVDTLRGIVAEDPEDVAVLQDIGRLSQAAGDFQTARDAYEKILTVDPKHRVALNNLAYLYSQRFGDLDRAYELAKAASLEHPDDPAIADTIGWILYQRGDYASALYWLRQSAERLPEEPEVHFHLGMTLYMSGEPAEARNHLRLAGQGGPTFAENQEFKRRMAVLELDVSRDSAASVRTLRSVLESTPGDPVALTKLGEALEAMGNLTEAISTYEAAIQRSPKNVAASLGLARLYANHVHDSQRAMEWVRKARELAPADPRIGHMLGTLAYRLGEHVWAVGLLEQSARQLRQDGPLLYDLAWAQYCVGRVGEAVETMKRSVSSGLGGAEVKAAEQFLRYHDLTSDLPRARSALDEISQTLENQPSYLPARFLKARLAESAGEIDDARAGYQAILARDAFPAFYPASRQLAVLLTENIGDYLAAYEPASRAREAYPNDAAVAKALGMASVARRQFGRAVLLLNESARERPQDAELFYHLGVAESELQHTSEAVSALEKALELSPNAPFALKAKELLDAVKSP